MIRYDNDCVGCPQGCCNCGRGRYPVWECDGEGCGFTTDDSNYIYEVGDRHYCEECYYKMFGNFEGAVTARKAMEERERYDGE